ncbi:hypothetical protein AB991_02005 [Helicobacter pylori]|nr:hypothetical protein AB991_02005 [Helicobacter pylori]
MSRIIEKYCGFYRNETLLNRLGNRFYLNKKLGLRFNAIRITTDTMRFCCWLVLFLGVLKSFVFIKI